ESSPPPRTPTRWTAGSRGGSPCSSFGPASSTCASAASSRSTWTGGASTPDWPNAPPTRPSRWAPSRSPSAATGLRRSTLSKTGGPSSRAACTFSSGVASRLDTPAASRDHPRTPIMNGVHDLGGMHGFGPIEREPNEPSFHADWEKAVLVMNLAGMVGRIYNLDEFRHGVERMDQARYLRTSYYEHWLASIETLFVEKGVVHSKELDARTRHFEQNPNA